MTRYKVIPLTELLKLPSDWQWPSTWRDEFCEKFEQALNRMAKEGWLYVDKFDWSNQGDVYNVMIVFRSEPEPSADSPNWPSSQIL
jgi:hypothetical protein